MADREETQKDGRDQSDEDITNSTDVSSRVSSSVGKNILKDDIISVKDINDTIASLDNLNIAEKFVEDSQKSQFHHISTSASTELDAKYKEDNLRKKLQSLQCPFTWDLKSENFGDGTKCIISCTNEKIKEIEGGALQWRIFSLFLILGYEYSLINDFKNAEKHVNECMKIVTSTDPRGLLYGNFFLDKRDAFLHVILACKCHLHFLKRDLDKVELTLQGIKKEADMNNVCRAALWGVRATITMEYGYEGTKAGVGLIEEALKLDEDEGEWHFIKGKCLGRIRRVDTFNEIPTPEELKALEKAVSITKNPSYSIFLAQAYREAAFKVFSKNKNNNDRLKDTVAEMNRRSAELYKESLELQGDCSHINIRCAQGFLKLPVPFRDIEKAKECCMKALKLAPNNAMVNHLRATLFEKFEGDHENAKKYYQKAADNGAFGAYMDMIRMEYKKDCKYDPLPVFEKILQRYTEKPRIEETLCQMGSYYFFMLEDIATAYKNYWLRVIEDNPHSDKLKTHKCIFLQSMKAPVSIYQLLYEDALTNLHKDSISFEEVQLYEDIISKCESLFPELAQPTSEPIRIRILAEEQRMSTRQIRSRAHSQNADRNRNIFTGRRRGTEGRRGTSRGRGAEDERGRGWQRGGVCRSRIGVEEERRREVGDVEGRDWRSRRGEVERGRGVWRSRTGGEERRGGGGGGGEVEKGRGVWRSRGGGGGERGRGVWRSRTDAEERRGGGGERVEGEERGRGVWRCVTGGGERRRGGGGERVEGGIWRRGGERGRYWRRGEVGSDVIERGRGKEE